MDWLYRMIGHVDMHTKNKVLSSTSRSWLVRRVDESDGSVSAHARNQKTWWEDKAEAKSQQPMMVSATEDVASSGYVLQRSESTKLPQLKLSEVLDTPVFLSDFRNHLEENFTAQGLNYLETFDTWNELDHKADMNKFVKTAHRMYQRFIDPSGDEIVSIPMDVRKRVLKTVENALESLKKDEKDEKIAQTSIKLREIFLEARQHVLTHMEEVLYPRFLKSEEYEEMIAVRFEDDSESKGAAAAYKGPSWTNDAGFKTVKVTINCAEDIAAVKKVWCLVSVDSRTYRTQPINPVRVSSSTSNVTTWDDEFQFPISSTTQHVKISLWTSGLIGESFLGRAYIPVAAIHATKNPIHKVKLLPRQYGEKVQGLVQTTLLLSTEEPKDLGRFFVFYFYLGSPLSFSLYPSTSLFLSLSIYIYIYIPLCISLCLSLFLSHSHYLPHSLCLSLFAFPYHSLPSPCSLPYHNFFFFTSPSLSLPRDRQETGETGRRRRHECPCECVPWPRL